MSAISPAPSLAPGPSVQHSFDGDVDILNATFDRRTEIRKVLTTLFRDLSKLEGRPVQIVGDIRLRVARPDAREHTYSVSVSHPDFDVEEFARQLPASENAAEGSQRAPGIAVAGSPQGEVVLGRSAPRRTTSNERVDDDVVEIPPPKRPRVGGVASSVSGGLSRGIAGEPLEISTQPAATSRVNELFAFIKQWHTEWTKQGGWVWN